MAEGWQAAKQPYAFELSNGNLFALAGVWDAWKDGHGHWLQSFAIVTTEANEMMARIHPRMPVILHPSAYDRWLDPEETERLPVDLLRPFESEAMEMREANPKVNNARNNGPEMLERFFRCCGIRAAPFVVRLSRRCSRRTTGWGQDTAQTPLRVHPGLS